MKLLIGLSLLLCQTAFGDQIGNITYTIDTAGVKWIAQDTYKAEGQEVITYTKEGESQSKWNELFTVQSATGLRMSPKCFFDLFINQLKTLSNGKDLKSQITKEDDHELFAKWWIDDGSLDSQQEWIRIIQHDDALIVFRFTSKNIKESETSTKKAEALLNSAKLSK